MFWRECPRPGLPCRRLHHVLLVHLADRLLMHPVAPRPWPLPWTHLPSLRRFATRFDVARRSTFAPSRRNLGPEPTPLRVGWGSTPIGWGEVLGFVQGKGRAHAGKEGSRWMEATSMEITCVFRVDRQEQTLKDGRGGPVGSMCPPWRQMWVQTLPPPWRFWKRRHDHCQACLRNNARCTQCICKRMVPAR